MSQAEPLTEAVVAVVEHLGQATSRQVLDLLSPRRPGLAIADVSRALYLAALRRRLYRERLRDVGSCASQFLYRPRDEELPPVIGERFRDLLNPYPWKTA